MHHRIPKFTLFVLAILVSGLATGCSQLRRARHLSRGDKYYAAGEYSAAEIEYLNVLKVDRLNAHAIGRLGLIYFDEGRMARAYPFLTKAVELEPNDFNLRAKAGMLYLATGDAKKAREQAEAVLGKSPTNSEAPLLLAQSVRTKEELASVRQQLEKLRKQVGDTAPVELGLGTLELRSGDLKSADTNFERAVMLDPKSSEAHAALAAMDWAQNNLTNADQQFKIAVSLAPLRSPLRLQYAGFKLKTGDVEEASNLLTEVTKGAPDYLPAWTSLAELALAQRQYTNCASLLGQALTRDANDYNALLLQARLELAQNQTDKAISGLERLSTLYPHSPMVLYQLAVASLAKSDTAKASGYLTRALALDPGFDAAILLQAQIHIGNDNTDSAITALTQVLKRQPGLAQAYLLLISAYNRAGDYARALAVCQQLGKLFPQNAQVPLLAGQIYLQEKMTAEARTEFEKSLTLAPDFLPPLEQLVNLDLAATNYSAALTRIQGKQEKWPKSPVLEVLLARVYSARNQTNATEQALQKAIQFDPNYEPAYLMLAQVYVASKQNDKALAQLNDTVAKNPRDVSALMLMGMIQNDQRNYDAARASYEKLLAVNPDFGPALNNLAWLYAEHFHLLDQAFEMARKARELSPDNPYAEDTLGWVLYRRHQYTWALSLLQDAAAKLSDQPEVQFHLGMTYYMTDDEARAAKSLQRALDLKQDFLEKAEARQRLAVLAIDPQTAGPDAQAELEKQVARQPDDPVALAKLAEFYTRHGAPQKAANAYAQALKLNPNNPTVLMRSAELYLDQLHDTQRAMDLAKSAYKIASDDPRVSYLLGRLAFATGDQQWALSLFQKSAQKLSGNPDLLYDTAMAYYSLGRIADAESAMKEALQTGNTFARATQAKEFLDLAPLYLTPAKAVQAKPEAEQILKSDPANVPALMVMGAAAEQGGDSAKAGGIYAQVLKQFPDFIPAVKRLALIDAATSGQDKAAYDLAMKARRALPNDPDIARTLGILSYRRGDYTAAARFLNESTRNGLADGTSLYYLGMANYQLKNTQQSKAALQRALNLNLGSDLAAKAREVLAQLH